MLESEEICTLPICCNQRKPTVNSVCNKLSSPGSNIVISDTNQKNTSFISVFSGFIFTQVTAVSRETGHALQCKG